MISVVIPTLNAQRGLARTLGCLVPAAMEGLVRDVIIADGGSTDLTAQIAADAGAEFVPSETGRGCQLRTGAQLAKGPWLLFLHADTLLEPGWEPVARDFMQAIDRGERPAAAAAFRFALDVGGWRPALLERFVRLRCAAFALPYGDQGLLIPKGLYEALGGFRPIPLMEDVDFVRRLGRRRVAVLPSRATTSAERYVRNGYFMQSTRNALCLALFFLGVSPGSIAKVYR